GNRGGPGNPFARQVAALRSALLSALTPQDVEAVAQEVLRQAKEGNLAAARLLLSYALGKPAAAVDPDTLDLHEFGLYRARPAPPPPAAGAPPASAPDEKALALLGRLLGLTPPSANGAAGRAHRPGAPSTNGRGSPDGRGEANPR